MSQHEVGGERNCAVTGSSGYFGSRLCRYLEANGWRVFRLTSHSTGVFCDEIPFTLLHSTEPDVFARHQIHSLVHCAYDFRLRCSARHPGSERARLVRAPANRA